MYKKCLDYLKGKYSYLSDKLLFLCLKKLLIKYQVELYLKDQLGILVKREVNDNFEYIFKTKFSCDGMPYMIALNNSLYDDMICFDIGANIGITTIWMAKKTKIVYAFEPERKNLLRLKENLNINKITNVIIENNAVSNNCKDSILNISEDYGHHSLGVISISNKIIKKEKVNTISIDLYCLKNNIEKIDLLKIDVEGYEYEVLKGAIRMLRNKKIKKIIFEISKNILQELHKNPSQIINFLKNNEYEVTDINNNKITEKEVKSIQFEDLIAFPEKS